MYTLPHKWLAILLLYMHTAHCIAYTTTASGYLIIRDLTITENNNNQDSRRISVITYT